MSPLSRSLLALAALLAAADAELPNDYCGDLLIGNKTDHYITYKLTAPGGIVSIPDKCSLPGRTIVGQYISTCDAPYYTPTITPPLTESYVFPPNFSEVHIDCPSDVAGCMTLDVHVRQYCEMVAPKQRGH